MMEFVNGKDDIPYMKMENKKCLKAPTRLVVYQFSDSLSWFTKSKRMAGKHQIYYSPMEKYM